MSNPTINAYGSIVKSITAAPVVYDVADNGMVSGTQLFTIKWSDDAHIHDNHECTNGVLTIPQVGDKHKIRFKVRSIEVRPVPNQNSRCQFVAKVNYVFIPLTIKTPPNMNCHMHDDYITFTNKGWFNRIKGYFRRAV